MPVVSGADSVSGSGPIKGQMEEKPGGQSNVFMGLSGVHFDVTSRLSVHSTTPFIGLFASLSITLETSVDLE